MYVGGKQFSRVIVTQFLILISTLGIPVADFVEVLDAAAPVLLKVSLDSITEDLVKSPVRHWLLQLHVSFWVYRFIDGDLVDQGIVATGSRAAQERAQRE